MRTTVAGAAGMGNQTILTQAAREEAEFTGSPLPLAAAARYAAAPRLERFVARNVAEAQAFVRTGRPPKR